LKFEARVERDFSRFNFVLYKEKEMADFRRWFIALAVLALMAGLASAQVGLGGSTTAGLLTCNANYGSLPQVRAEGYTELVGDVLISCYGGSQLATAAQVPTTNIIVYMSPTNSAITSRLFGTGSSSGNGVPPQGTLSEVALLIDEPNSGLSSGIQGGAATGAYGPNAPQVVCTTITGCPTYVGVDAATGYEVSVNMGTTVAAPNVYQGYIGSSGANSVEFYGVPVLPPVTAGIARVFRVTNLRYPAVGLGNQAPISANVAVGSPQYMPLGTSSFPLAVVVSPGLTTTGSGPALTFAQCQPQTATYSAKLSFTEGFATAFKTRVIPLTNTQYAAEGIGTGQNIPGGRYGNGFALNSESGLVLPGDATSKYTAGLADFGTRLKAVFTNIPAGVTLYVSTQSEPTTPAITLAQAGTPTLLGAFAVLVATGTSGESTSDGTAFAPISGTTTGSGGGALPAIALAPNSAGTATAVWEVTNSSPSGIDTLVFDVYVGYAPGIPTSTNPYGLPGITTILGAPVSNVSLSFAPEPSQGAFSAAAGPVPGTNIIPRFSILNPANYQFVAIGLCQTTLLYPFVTANPSGALGQGFDTGLAVANTSMDPFGTKPYPIGNITSALQETGSCALYPYGVTLSSTGAPSAGPKTLPGCDTISGPAAGTNCFPVVAPGSVQTVLASTVFPGFQGYVIAVCNFQYAHGYAAVTDLGLRGLFSSYLALELAPNDFSSAGRGVSIEQLVH
jgi:hypothetical protein